MAENQDFPRVEDPRLEQAIHDLARAESRLPDEVTRRRHLAAMRNVRHGRRVGMRGVSAAAAAIALVFGLVTVSRSNDTTVVQGAEGGTTAELPPLREAPELSPVPFERSEDYVILRVDAAHASDVSSQLSGLVGGDPAVVGRTSKATTFVVPASAARSLTDPTGVSAIPDTKMKSTTQQTNPPSWGLDRMDSAALDNSYGYISPGAGEYVYVIDTGIYAGNSDFGGRVVSGYTAVNDGNGTNDCNGHGTHVAGTISGAKYGVAKSATVVAVRVLDCTGSGYSSSVVAGINWVIASHPGGAGVINLSLGGGANSAVDQAVADATAAGLVVVVAAGNSSADACSYSPARAPSALTIGAIDRTNAQASYSNYGSCVDMWAPGTGITSDYIGGSGATATMSGTSMATPHVAGMAARLMQARPGISASEIRSTLTSSSLTTNPTGLPMVEFAETPDYATPTTTTTVPDTTTTVPATTVDPGVTTTTAAPVVTTTTTVPATTTTVVKAPRGGGKKPKGADDGTPSTTLPLPVAPQPKEFSVRYGEDNDKGTMFASWEDNNTPESWRIECARMVGGANAPVDTTISLTRADVTNGEKGKHRAALLVVPAAGSRCWIVSIIGTVTSSRSNAAIVPPVPKKEGSKRPPVTTTTSTTTTTFPETATSTTVPDTTTTVVVSGRTVTTTKPTSTTVKPTTTTIRKSPPTTSKKPGKGKDD